jgi:hypothetical protein
VEEEIVLSAVLYSPLIVNERFRCCVISFLSAVLSSQSRVSQDEVKEKVMRKRKKEVASARDAQNKGCYESSTKRRRKRRCRGTGHGFGFGRSELR